MKKLFLTCLLAVLVYCLFGIPAETKTGLTFVNADLGTTKSGPATANVDTDISYTITLSNSGPDTATNATWSDPLPPALLFVSLNQDNGPAMTCNMPAPGDGGTISCSIASLSSGASAQFTLTVHIANTTPLGSTVSNTSSATSTTPDANGNNNNSTTTMTVFSPASIAGNKSRSGGTAPGASLTYLIVLSNSNFDQQDNPGNEFTDVLPIDLTLLDASASGGTATANTGSNTVTWNGVIPGGDSVTIVIDAIINLGTAGHTISNTGSISYDKDGNGTNEASATTNTDSFVVGSAPLNADVGVTKSAPDNVPADSDVTYNITVFNGGPDTATSATLTDALPGTMTFVSLSQPAGWSCDSLTPGSGGTLTCSRDLPPGSGPQAFTLVGHVPPGTANGTFYNNTATVSTTATDSTSENDQATAGTTVSCATNWIVTTSADSGPGSLRKAISDACVGGTITFDMTPGHVTSPITLTSGELLINQDLTIQGPGANVLTISGNNASRVFNISSGTVEISGLTISGGKRIGGASSGAGVLNSGTLTLLNSTVSDNDNDFVGGGISNTGTLTLTSSTVSGNNVTGGHLGGGIYSSIGTVNLVNSTVSGNTSAAGGGIFNFGGTVNITNGTISGNNAEGSGGGINNNSGTLTLTNSTVTNNRSDSNNFGGEVGGGIYITAGTVTLKNSILAGNFSGTGNTRSDISGAVDGTSSYNLIGDGTNMTGISNGSNGNQVGSAGSPINAMLGTLGNNGGPTQTHLLLVGSPAINAGNNANLPADTFDLNNNFDTAEPLPVDQRGIGFPRVVNTTVDIGAVEANYSVTATAGTLQSAPVNTAFGTALQATVNESGNPQSGVSVTFTPPASGPRGTFTGGNPATANTNASGIATAPSFTANGTAGAYNVVASIGNNLASANFALTNLKGNQTITFAPIANKTFGDADFVINPPASSGLPVALSASGQCTVTTPSPGTVHITGAGSCTITASQAGDSSYNPAGNVSQSFNIAKAATATALSSSLNPSDLGQSVTFTATVTSGAGTPNGTVQFKDNGNNLGVAVALNAAGVAQFTTSSLTAGNHNITADYSGAGNFQPSTGTLAGGQTVLFRPLIKFGQPSYSVSENGNFITITVVRSGNTAPAVSVDYTTPDDSASLTFLPCSNANGAASPRCDFTTALGTLNFGAGETSKTFTVLISQDVWVEGNETAALTLSNPTGGAAFQQPSDATAVLTIVDDDLVSVQTNPIDNTDTFVRQHYHDFLNREGDQQGIVFWTNQIESCGADAQCRAVRRVNVSAAFFLSIEFQNTGYFVYRMYKAGFNDIAPPTVPVPIRFTTFLRDTQIVETGVVVGQGNWQAQLDANKKAYALAFVQRLEFLNRYPALTSATAFVDSLNANAGMVLSDSERSALIAELSPSPSDPALRADVLQKVAENALLQQREFNRAFVLMQYIGYLRRNPDAAPEPGLNFNGFNFWLNKLNQFNGDYVGAEMIKAFITSGEYRGRFGP